MKIGIVGGGIFGTATAWEAAKRGHQVELFERDDIPSHLAASWDISKATRLEYGGLTPTYAPLVARAFQLWREAEEKSGESFFHNTGVICLARDFSPGSFEHESWTHLKSLGWEPEVVEPKEGKLRFPHYNWKRIDKATYNKMGGWVHASLATSSLAECARIDGAVIHKNTSVTSVDEGVIKVGDKIHSYDLVIVCAGAWVGRLLPSMTESARVSRQRITFYKPGGEFPVPVWIHDPAESGWYGFPMNADGIVKVALHQRSETVDPDASRELDAAFLEQSRAFVSDMLPGLKADSLEGGRCCFYTNSPSGDLVFQKLTDKLYVAGLGSGHGFKFGPVLGQLALDMVENGDERFALQAPAEVEAW